jgi:acyl-CoA thioester hydrolase
MLQQRKAEELPSVDVRVRVRYAETDQMGVVYYANYLIWFEVGRSEFCRDRGFEYRKLEEEFGLRLAVTEAQCRYLAPARYDDEIVIRTWLCEIRRRSLKFRYQIVRPDDSKVLAEGETVHVVIDGQGKPRTLPPVYADWLMPGETMPKPIQPDGSAGSLQSEDFTLERDNR